MSFIHRLRNFFDKSGGIEPLYTSPEQELAEFRQERAALLQQRRNAVPDAEIRLAQQPDTFVVKSAEDKTGKAWVVVMQSSSSNPPSIGRDFRLELIDPEQDHDSHPFINARREQGHIYIDETNALNQKGNEREGRGTLLVRTLQCLASQWNQGIKGTSTPPAPVTNKDQEDLNAFWKHCGFHVGSAKRSPQIYWTP